MSTLDVNGKLQCKLAKYNRRESLPGKSRMRLFLALVLGGASTAAGQFEPGAICGGSPTTPLSGKHLRVATIDGWPPFSKYTTDGTVGVSTDVSGWDVDLIELVAKRLNFTYDLVIDPQGDEKFTPYAYRLADNYDLVLSWWTFSLERANRVRMLRGHVDTNFYLATRPPGYQRKYQADMSDFDRGLQRYIDGALLMSFEALRPEAVLFLFGCVLYTAFAIWILTADNLLWFLTPEQPTWRGYFWRFWEGACRSRKVAEGGVSDTSRLGEYLFDLTRGLLFNDHIEPVNERHNGRYVGLRLNWVADLTFGLLSLYFVALYTANLTTVYNQRAMFAIRGVDDLVQNNMEVCYFARTKKHADLKNKLMALYPMLSTIDYGYKQLGDASYNTPELSEERDAAVRALKNGDCHALVYANDGFHSEEFSSLKESCWLHHIGSVSHLQPFEPGWITNYASQCVGDHIEPVLHDLVAQGIMKELASRDYPKYNRTKCDTAGPFPQEPDLQPETGIGTMRESLTLPAVSIGASGYDVAFPVSLHLLVVTVLVVFKLVCPCVRWRAMTHPSGSDPERPGRVSKQPSRLNARRAQMAVIRDMQSTINVLQSTAFVAGTDAAKGPIA